MGALSAVLTARDRSLACEKLTRLLISIEEGGVLAEWDHLYVCAREKGKEVASTWISAAKYSRARAEEALNPVIENATSFEVELLFKPEKRVLDLGHDHHWNSLRGKRAMFIDHGGHFSRWASLDMIARNLSFRSGVNRHLAQCRSGALPDRIGVVLYHTQQYFCDNTSSSHGQAEAVELFRGNQILPLEAVTKERVNLAIQNMVRWLASQVNAEGQANYKYWPSRGEYASSNNAIRQWMATICLNRAAKLLGYKALAKLAANNLSYNIRTQYRQDGSLGYIWMNDSAKLGAAALAALAILESPERKRYLQQEYGLRRLIHELSNSDGSFDTFYVPRDRKDNQNFYSGEALLFLATQYSISRNPAELDRLMSAFYYYREWHRQNRNPAFVPWHTQAYYLVWKVTKNEHLKDFIFEMNDWLLPMQQWDSAEFGDMRGRFYDPARPYFGPPHASSTGVYLEGLVDAFSLARQCEDHKRIELYRLAILRGIRSIIQLQFKDEVDCYYIKQIDRVWGGVRTTVYDNTVRIDNVQHALAALFKIYCRFSEREYSASYRRAVLL